jgi:hypothetical protein
MAAVFKLAKWTHFSIWLLLQMFHNFVQYMHTLHLFCLIRPILLMYWNQNKYWHSQDRFQEKGKENLVRVTPVFSFWTAGHLTSVAMVTHTFLKPSSFCIRSLCLAIIRFIIPLYNNSISHILGSDYAEFARRDIGDVTITHISTPCKKCIFMSSFTTAILAW